MSSYERALLIVRNHRAAHVLPEVSALSNLMVIAVVLSTEREGSPDAVVDHELWFACMKAVDTVVTATSCEIQVARRRSFLSWLFPRKPRSFQSLDAYMAQLRTDEDGADWQTIFWRKGEQIVAAATCERWYLTGGSGHYHDSYTTSIFLTRAAAARLLPVLQVSVNKAGGHIEAAIDADSAA